MLGSEYILKKIESHGAKTAQVDAETKQIISFDDIRGKSEALTRWLLARGLGRGFTIGLMSRNSLEFAWILFGIWKSGAACHLIDPNYTLREVTHALRTAPVDALVLQRGVFQTLASPETERITLVLEFGEKDTPYSQAAIPLDTIFKSEESVSCKSRPNGSIDGPQRVSHLDRLALVISSSGTSGLPKGVIHTEASILTGLELSSSNQLVHDDDKIVGLMPFHHVFGLHVLFNSLCAGATMVVMPKFSLPVFIETIKIFSITRLHLVPSLLMTFLKSNSLDFQDLISVRHLCVGGAPVLEDRIEKLMEKFLQPVIIQKVYGCSESFHHIFPQMYEPEKPGSLGKVVQSLHAKIVDVNKGEVLGANSVGELCIKGSTITPGYINNPEATTRAFDSDGWFLTGDLGYFDEDGYFFFVDRLKNIIKYQGHQVSPSELEFVLNAHPNIVEAAVTGIEHEIFGQVPRAFVVLRGIHENAAQDIHDYLRGVLAPFKLLRGGLILTSNIPKTSSGKLQLQSLKNSNLQAIHFDRNMKRLPVEPTRRVDNVYRN